jgi:hypothetical protein
MAQEHEKAELIAELAQARAGMTRNVAALRHDLDFAARARNSFAKNPMLWLGGAALLGLIIARIPGRKGKVHTVRVEKAEPVVAQAGKAGLVLGALKIAFDFARPTLMKWATQRVSDYMEAKGGSNR